MPFPSCTFVAAGRKNDYSGLHETLPAPMLEVTEVTRSVSIWNRSCFGNCPMLEVAVTRSVSI